MRNLIFIVVIALTLIFTVFSLFRKKWPRRSVKWLCVAGGMVCALALGYFWCCPAWSYPDVTGPYGVATAACTYTDENRPDAVIFNFAELKELFPKAPKVAWEKVRRA